MPLYNIKAFLILAFVHTHKHTHTAKASYRDCPGQPSSTPCQETIESIPGMVTFNTRVDFTGGGSLNLTQEIKRLQLYRGTGRFAANLLYACDTNSVECTNSGNAIVIQGDPELKYDISVQLQLTESDSGTYTAFLDAFDPISGSDVESSKSFTVEISEFTSYTVTTQCGNTNCIIHTCTITNHLSGMCVQNICCMSQTGQYESCKGECCPVWDISQGSTEGEARGTFKASKGDNFPKVDNGSYTPLHSHCALSILYYA